MDFNTRLTARCRPKGTSDTTDHVVKIQEAKYEIADLQFKVKDSCSQLDSIEENVTCPTILL